MTLSRIVSGGQNGVDRGALDTALAATFPCGGWCPAGRLAEDGVIPERYPLMVLIGAGYSQRTRKNVQDSDGTLILFAGILSGGTELTRDLCVHERKPFVTLDAEIILVEAAVTAAIRFIREKELSVMNVAAAGE